MLNIKALSGAQKFSIMLFTSVILGGSGLLVYSLLNPEQVKIFENQSLEQVSKVTEQLEAQGIDYQLDAAGTGVLVNDATANKVKVKLAQIASGENQTVGFELFDNVDYSMTEHAQKVTYQRALQGELERTLTSYHEIESARVHIMIPQRKLFALEMAKAKASVSVIQVPGATLSDNQIAGIQGVIAASVEGLLEHDVIVLNGDGLKISANHAKTKTPGEPQTKGQIALEQQLTEKAMRILGLYFDLSQIAVSVSAELDFTQTKQIDKKLLADANDQGYITRKKETLSYRKTKDGEGEVAPDKKSEIEFELGSQTKETLSYAGALKQLNVAIAIVADIDENDMQKLSHLITAGLGINLLRGDKLSVESFMPISRAKSVVPVPVPVPTFVAPIQEIVAQEPQLVIIPEQNYLLDLTDRQIMVALIVIAALILLLMLTRLFSGNRPKALTEQSKQEALLQFNDWINQAPTMGQHEQKGEQHAR
jgi:flagellar M-ring protein FliF